MTFMYSYNYFDSDSCSRVSDNKNNSIKKKKIGVARLILIRAISRSNCSANDHVSSATLIKHTKDDSAVVIIRTRQMSKI